MESKYADNPGEFRPTCQAVTRPGQRGVRVWPKGCRVRRRVAANGELLQFTEDGVLEQHVYEPERESTVRFGLSGSWADAIWDTGATGCSVNTDDAYRFGLLPASPGSGTLGEALEKRQITVVLADGSSRPSMLFKNCPLTVQIRGRNYDITVDVGLSPPGGDNLFGVSGISQLPGVTIHFFEDI